MDSLYGASFTPWLKNEENVMVTATYLQRVCNEYCFPRIVTAIRWLEKGWKPDSTAWLIKHITQHWGTGNRCSTEKIDIARAIFIQCLMEQWTKQKKGEFVPIFLDLTYPNSNPRRLVFLKTLFDKMDFEELTELFSIMGSGLDYSTKVVILQMAAGRNNKLKAKRQVETHTTEESPKKTKCYESIPSNNSLGLVMTSEENHHMNESLEDIFENVNTTSINNISLIDNTTNSSIYNKTLN
ncbi:hypothetical protein K502DRAFT_325012 [Neoconidiobolus thromboides FSU 785]|nr:hypothetical protein K502DRAFT_325012 [Neoconidiobolus thromboides FSU 785]